MSQYQVAHWINGSLQSGSGTQTQDIFNPATGQVQGQLHLAAVADLDAAVKSAQAASAAWGNTPALQRSRVMFRFLELVQSRREQLAECLTREHGKTREDALGEIARGIENIEFACGMPQLLKGEYTEQIARGIDAWTTRQPLGVVAGITPFNFPAMVPLWMFPLALGCGNCFILKPS